MVAWSKQRSALLCMVQLGIYAPQAPSLSTTPKRMSIPPIAPFNVQHPTLVVKGKAIGAPLGKTLSSPTRTAINALCVDLHLQTAPRPAPMSLAATACAMKVLVPTMAQCAVVDGGRLRPKLACGNAMLIATTTMVGTGPT